MHPILSAIGSVATLRFRSRASLELEVIALRHQLGVLRRKAPKKIHVRLADRFFWVWFYRFWPRVLDSMVLVKPKTVISWHYSGFRMFWRWRSDRRGVSTTRFGPEIRDLIYQMKRDNPTWGIRRIEGEMKKLGYKISRTTIRRLLPIPFKPMSPGWRTFLNNHMKETAAVDFMVVVTATFQLLYAVIVLSHSRRRIVHYDVTDHPTQEWAADQVCCAFARYPKPKFLIRDRDAIFGKAFRARMEELGITEKVTMRQSPWQNALVERVIQSIRRECLDHVIIMNPRHLRRMLSSYVDYYNNSRTHLWLDKDSPVHRRVERPSRGKRIVAIPQVGGLHHRYERRAA